MIKPAVLFTILSCFYFSAAQDVSLPADLRQHALTQYNASLFNPAFSLDRNNPQSISFWTRWQWQNIDSDPTTLFLNYTRNLNEQSVAGAGFFQQNTGVYFNTGGALNYAYEIQFNRLIKLSVGANVFGFVQQIADDRFPVNPIPGIPQATPTDDFILQVAPGFNLSVENFSMSLASENLFDYNFSDSASNTATADKIFMGMASYDFPVMASDSTAYIRPAIYLRTIPEQENQIGLNALLSTQKYWAQAGYNNFYGISVGGGGTFLNKFSIGALVEFGISSSLNSKDPSFELVASYFLGKPEERRKIVASGIDDLDQKTVLTQNLTIEQMREELERAEAEANAKNEEKETKEDKADENTTVIAANDSEKNETEKTSEEIDKKEQRRIAAEQKSIEKQKRKDSVAAVKKEEAALAALQKQQREEARIAQKAAEEATKREQALAEAEMAKAKLKTRDSLVIVRKENEALARREKELAAEKTKEEKRLADLRKQDEVKAAAIEKERIEQQRVIDSIQEAEKTEALAAAAALKEQERIAEVKKKEALAKTKDSLANAKRIADELAAAEEVVENQASKEEVTPQAGEKYEEVITEDGLQPGFYLIANVFGTKKYFDAFMSDLNAKGIQAQSFFRSKNKYNYAYLERFDTIGEARRARDSNYNGKYAGKTWIFRVVGN